MISPRKASEDLDRLEDMLKASKSSYVHAIQSAAQYAIEVDPAEAISFRAHLELIRADAERAAYPDDWPALQSSLRGELRDYRDRSLAHLAKLRSEMKAAVAAMQAFASSVAENGTDHHEELQAALQTLHSAAHTHTLDGLRAAIAQTSTQIGASVARMERAHTLVLAQLRDEIRLLHQQVDAGRRARQMDGAMDVWNRQKMDSQLEEMLAAQESFCVLIVSIRNLKRLDQRYSPVMLEGGVEALLRRFLTMIEEQAVVGRWEEDAFAAILRMEPAAAIALSREAAQRLSGTYAVQENGMSRSIELRVAAGVIDRSQGADANLFRQKLLQMSAALTSA